MGARQAAGHGGVGGPRRADTATATLSTIWTFPGVEQTWTYTTDGVAGRGRAAGGRPAGSRTSSSRSSTAPTGSPSRRLDPERGELLGEDGDPIVQLRPVVRIGLDKSALKPDAVAASVRAPGPAGRHRRQGVRGQGDGGRAARRSSRRSSSGPGRGPAAEPGGVRDPRRTADRGRPDARRRPGTSPDRSSARSARRPRRSSTSPAAPWSPATRSASPACSSATTSSCAARPASRCSWSAPKADRQLGQPVPEPVRPRTSPGRASR